MGYLIKSNVIDAIEEDMHSTMMCYEGKEKKDIVEFCYECMRRAIEELPQYRPDNVFEDTGLTPPEIMELKERDKPRKIELNAGIPTCPVCGRRVVRCYDFCPDCGQRLKQ